MQSSTDVLLSYNIHLSSEMISVFESTCVKSEIEYEVLALELEAYLMNKKKTDKKLTKEDFESIIQDLKKKTLKKRKLEKVTPKKNIPIASPVKTTPKKIESHIPEPTISSPIPLEEIHSSIPETIIYNKFTIKNTFKTFNPDLKWTPSDVQPIIECKTPLVTKYMNKMDSLVNLFFEKQRYFADFFRIEFSTLGSTNDEAHYFGRILCDSTSGQDVLNSESVLFESLTQDGQSIVVKLKGDVIGLYSGQLVVVYGKHSRGGGLNVIEFLKMPVSVISGHVKDNLKIIVSCGPFVVGNSHDRFNEMMTNVTKEEPNIVILVGPFLSNVDDMDNVFKTMCGKLDAKYILIPSVDDEFHDCVYPQPPLRGIRSFQNPCVLSISGLSIGITSLDIVQNVSKIGRYFEQQTWYPYFGMNHVGPVDWNLSQLLNLVQISPIMILPSTQSFLVQSIENVICVNPKKGLLTKIHVIAGDTCPERIKIEMI